MKKNLKNIVNFLFEVGILSKTPRSGFHFLGSGEQSVAEHINRVVYVGYVLSTMEKNVDTAKVLKMCLFHDLAEARTSDLNYVHQKYTVSDEERAIHDLAKTVPFGEDILSLLQEHKERKTKEALLAKDADTIEWILSLKEHVDIGNTRAKTWIPSSIKRLKTDVAKKLAEEILATESDEWWFSNKEDDWWVNRNSKAVKKRF
ncbi:MAG: phosphohydrolase [Patescibacteria group bacterium]|nr:MAG: phosphohydrolase [Patescibacteria group bacterium]